MHIIKFQITNFKCFSQITLHDLNDDINILTGVNNSGKTTILEALALWNECFNHLIFQAKRADNRLNLNEGDYRFYARPTETYFARESLISVKKPQYDSLFHNLTHEMIYLEVTLSKNQEQIMIGFGIRLVRRRVYVITLESKPFDYLKFNTFFKHFPHPIKIVYASSVATLNIIEAFETKPKVDHYVHSHQSMQVLRNRLYRLYYMVQESLLYPRFIRDLEYILLNNQEKIELSFLTEPQTDVHVIVNLKIGQQTTPLDIALLGSGTLQVIEILLSCYEETEDLGIILLDEPDSHIHRDIQKRLLNVLVKHADRKQVFLTTHNESLIRSANPTHLFHLLASPMGEYWPIVSSQYLPGPKIGLQPSRQIKILESLGSESALDYLNAIEADKLIIVEGHDDARYIQTILSNKHQIADNAPQVMFWAMGGLDEIIKHIETYKHFFSHIKNKTSLWDKTVLVFDKDRLTQTHRNNLMVALPAKLGISVYIWAAYTIESTLLIELDQFVTLLDKYARNLEKKRQFTWHDLQQIVQDEISHLIAQKKQDINSVQSRTALQDYLLNRRAKLESHLKLKIKSVMPGSEAELSPKTTAETLDALERGELYTVATKNDVDTLIKKSLARLNITLSTEIDYYFIELLELAKYSPWFAEWDNMIQTLNIY
jgi:AAA15 family ATPase/GTPase